MEERNDLIRWIKKHRKKLIIAGIGITTLISAVLLIKNREQLRSLWDSLRKVAEQPTVKAMDTATEIAAEILPETSQEVVTAVVSNSEPTTFEVRSFIRNLPNGWHASPEKIAEARKYNIDLRDGQTLVDGYTKRRVAA